MSIRGIQRDFPGKFRTIDLSEYTTWNIGGPCVAAFVSSSGELAETSGILRERSVPWAVLGRGSNTLAPSRGWDGAVVILSGGFQRFRFEEDGLFAGGGAPLPSMAGASCSRGLSGLEFAVGIPGTAGGAVFMNAGAYGSCMADLVREVTLFTAHGEFVSVSVDECGFAYRTSAFQEDGSVITGMKLQLSPHSGGAEELRNRAVEILRLRRRKFPLSVPNAGSVFKRPEQGPPPGKLIEDCGLKGLSRGGAFVSSIHANFIENRGGATSDDVKELIEAVRRTVESVTGIELQREIKFLGEDS